MLSRRLARTALAALSIFVVLGGCRKPEPVPELEPTPATLERLPTATSAPDAGPARGLLAEAAPGIRLRLSDADPAAVASGGEAVRTVEGEPLDEARLAELLERVPILPPDASAAVDFAVRPGPPPPAIAGDTIPVAFPPPAAAAPPRDGASEPLKVARYQPEGDVDIASHVAVTFSGPFAPVASNALLDAADVPVRLSPQPAGRWRWVGTQTLIFEPEAGRMPYSTDFGVEVPAGALAADGRLLMKGASWTFRTPAPLMAGTWPHAGAKSVDRRTVIVIAYDQAIDRAAVLPLITVEADGQAVPVRMATAEDVAADDAAARIVAREDEGRVIAIKPEAALPGSAQIVVEVASGVPGTEGPRRSQDEQSFAFQTYGPFEVSGLECWDDSYSRVSVAFEGDAPQSSVVSVVNCDPTLPLSVEFSNPVDAGAFDESLWSIVPTVPGLRIDGGNGHYVQITGRFQGRTNYQVTVPAGIRDEFGQALETGRALIFKTARHPHALFVPGQDRTPITLDPFGPPEVTIQARTFTRISVELFRVSPSDWPEFHRSHAYGRIGRAKRVGTPAATIELDVPDALDDFARLPIDLSPALENGLGHVVAIVQPTRGLPAEPGVQYFRQHRWFQVTRLGLDVLGDALGLTAWVTDLTSGEPIVGSGVRYGEDPVQHTMSDGLARLEHPGNADESAPYVVAERGQDSVIVANSGIRAQPETVLAWHVYDDRGLYRPGETARVKGLIRRLGTRTGGDVSAFEAAAGTLGWALSASNGHEVASGESPVSASGAFDIAVPLPADMAVGHATLQLALQGEPLSGSRRALGLHIAEFRRPAFEITAESEQPDAIVGEPARVAVAARYFAGGALAGADVAWQVEAKRTAFAPPGWPGFAFGAWAPWWRLYGEAERVHQVFQQWPATTDQTGAHRLEVEVSGVEPPGPVSVMAEASVQDVDRQAQAGSVALLFHPSQLYVGLRTESRVIEPGETIAVEAIVTGIDGEALAGRIVEIAVERLDDRYTSAGWEEVAVAVDGCRELVSELEPVTCPVTLRDGGSYRVRATVRDDAGRANQADLRVWLPSTRPRPTAAGIDEQAVELIPDRDAYAPGDTAHVLLVAPFLPAEATITLRRQGIVEIRRQRLTQASTIVDVPIEDGYTPNITLAVDLVGVSPRDGAAGEAPEAAGANSSRDDERSAEEAAPPEHAEPLMPAFASGAVDLPVPPHARTLGVDLAPAEDVLKPSGATKVGIAVTGADGEPLADAEVALIVVDEAVLALSGWQAPDPLATFYGTRYAGVAMSRSRSNVVLSDLDVPPTPAPLPSRTGGGDPDASAGTVDDARLGALPSIARDASGLVPDLSITATALFSSLRATPVAPAPATGGIDSIDRDASQGQAQPDPGPVVMERTNLDPLAAFLPDLRTDATGHVTATIALPDNVTRYRITAVATDGGQRFGVGSSALTAELPLVIRPSAPRFLNFGDRFELPLVVQNRADEPRTVDVVVRAGNLAVGEGPATQATSGIYRSNRTYATDTTDGTAAADTTDGTSAAYRITIPADDRVELRIPAAAARPGTAAFQAAVFDVDDLSASDAQRVTLPVWTPATTEAFATYGTLDDGAVRQPVVRPADVVPGVGGLEVTLSSTALAELTDAFLYLHSYPYEGAEQIASRVLAVVAMRDVLAAFGAEGLPPAAEIDAAMAADLERLARLQRDDGGFGWWPNMEREADPFVTAHVAHALVRAREADYAVDGERVERALAWLRDIRDHMNRRDWSEDARLTVEAQALYVRALAGDVNGDRAVALVDEGGDDAPIDRLGWLLSVLARDESRSTAAASLAERLENRVDETASTAQFTTSYHEVDGAMLLASDRRTDAIVLDAWMIHNPESDLTPKLVRGLLDGREKGRWHTTQESIWALLALNAYFRRFEAVEPAFTARAWLDDGLAGEARFEGRSPDRAQLSLPLDVLPETGAADLTLGKEGPGRLYYRLGLRYAPSDLTLDADERGFAVTRAYEGADDPGDVRRTADGTIEVKAGARVRVRLTMVAPARRYHVALVDPLPAGLEAENPDLATTARLSPPVDEGDDASRGASRIWWWWGNWYDHAGFRDDRVEVFGERVEAGVWTYTYLARATVPGTYVVPPLKAEEMYHPETYGRSATETVRVVP